MRQTENRFLKRKIQYSPDRILASIQILLYNELVNEEKSRQETMTDRSIRI